MLCNFFFYCFPGRSLKSTASLWTGRDSLSKPDCSPQNFNPIEKDLIHSDWFIKDIWVLHFSTFGFEKRQQKIKLLFAGDAPVVIENYNKYWVRGINRL